MVTEQDEVRVENRQIVADPARMIQGLAYPVLYQKRRWWVVKVDGDLIRFYEGPPDPREQAPRKLGDFRDVAMIVVGSGLLTVFLWWVTP